MNTRLRNNLTRIIIAVAVFAYVGYMGWQQLPRFDFWVIMSFFLLYGFWAIATELWIYQDPDDFVTEDSDQKSYLYLQLSFIAALFFATIDFVEIHVTRVIVWEPYVIYIGFILFLISCYVRWSGFRSIGKYFNPRVAVYQYHKLIVEGAYRRIRHPLYLGSFISFIAIPMVFNSWGAMLIIVCLTVPALIYRIRIEEEFMIKQLGEDYENYQKVTRKMIPGIW
ncbi:MAG: isoprenylcysteine carboxylmethyltransferase family protein [Bacillota bacterium]|nr:isoprenylcysteine carboxylmethyltransferase family protein [Bacillota bacterium]